MKIDFPNLQSVSEDSRDFSRNLSNVFRKPAAQSRMISCSAGLPKDGFQLRLHGLSNE